MLNDVLSSTRLKQFCSSPIVFTPMDPDIAPDSPGGCTGHDPVLAPGSLAARKRKPRRLRQEGAVGVAIMISDTRGPLARRHDSICGSAASRGKIRHRRPYPRVDQVALGINRRWQERGTWLARVGASSIASRYSLDSWEYLCLATAAGVECRVVLASRVTSHSNDLNANNSKKITKWAAAATRIFFLKKKQSRKSKKKKHKFGVLPTRMVSDHVVPLKGTVLDWVIQQCARDLERMGHYGQVTLNSDQEPAIVDVLAEIANLRGSRGTLLEHSPVADSQSNGFIERRIRSAEEMTREE